MFKCSNVQIFKCSNVQMFKCSNVLMFQCSNINQDKLLLERTSGVPPVIFVIMLDLLIKEQPWPHLKLALTWSNGASLILMGAKDLGKVNIGLFIIYVPLPCLNLVSAYNMLRWVTSTTTL